MADHLTCDNGKLNLYKYMPSVAAAAIFAIIFAAVTIGHVVRMIMSRQWFMVALIVGGAFEIVGYVFRIIGHNDPCTLGTYIIQSVLILVAPSIFSATIYMILGRTVRAVRGEALSPIRPTWLTKIFVSGDVLCFLVQGGGGGILAGADKDADKATLGKNVILAGLVLQILLFGVFVFVAWKFHTRLRRTPTEMSHRPDIRWATMLHVLYGVSVLIMIRSIFRVIEYVSGQDGYLLTHEWPLYVFDAIFMASVMGTLLWFYPTLIRPKTMYGADAIEAQPLDHNGHSRYKNLSANSPSYSPSPSPAPYGYGHGN